MSTQTQQSTQQSTETFMDLTSMLANPEQELADMNPERDPFVQPRINEGWYQGTVEYREKDASKRWQKKEGTDQDGNAQWWYSTKILAKITKDGDGDDTEFEGRTVAPEYLGTVTTKLRKNGASTVSGICLHAGMKVETKTHAGQAATLEKVIQQSLPVKFVVRHDLKFSVKEGDQYHEILVIKGTRNPDWPKNDDGTPDYSPAIYAIHDASVGWRLAQAGDPQDKLVEVNGRVDVVVDRFAPIVK